MTVVPVVVDVELGVEPVNAVVDSVMGSVVITDSVA